MTRITLLLLFGLAICSAGCGRPHGPPAPSTAEISAAAGAPAADLPDPQIAADDWPQWRGPNEDGVSTGPAVPVRWKDGSAPENIVWKQQIPGRGHSSPIIVGDHVYVATADDQAQVQSVLSLSRADGKQVWKTDLFQGNFEKAMHGENTQASSTVACDGERLFAAFLNDRKIWMVALDLAGKEVWRKEVGGFTSKFGYSSSPTFYKSLVIIAADHQTGGFLAALNRKTGEIIWRKKRQEASSYASPRVVTVSGKDELVICGCDVVASYDPLTGEQNWSTKGTTEASVGTMVVSGDLMFASGGYPGRDTVALTSTGQVVWRNSEKSYVPSLIAYQDHLYMVNDDGVAYCYEAKTGQERWKKRIGGNFRVSPVLNDGHLFTTDMSGKTTVFKAQPTQFEIVAENQLGTEGFSSPGISKGQLFMRVGDNSSGQRHDWIYCIGKK